MLPGKLGGQEGDGGDVESDPLEGREGQERVEAGARGEALLGGCEGQQGGGREESGEGGRALSLRLRLKVGNPAARHAPGGAQGPPRAGGSPRFASAGSEGPPVQRARRLPARVGHDVEGSASQRTAAYPVKHRRLGAIKAACVRPTCRNV